MLFSHHHHHVAKMSSFHCWSHRFNRALIVTPHTYIYGNFDRSFSAYNFLYCLTSLSLSLPLLICMPVWKHLQFSLALKKRSSNAHERWNVAHLLLGCCFNIFFPLCRLRNLFRWLKYFLHFSYGHYQAVVFTNWTYLFVTIPVF